MYSGAICGAIERGGTSRSAPDTAMGAGMRALRGAIPRAFPDHRRPDARAYAAECRAILCELGPLPRTAMALLREYGLLAAVDLPRVNAEYRTARTDVQRRRLRRQL